MGILCFSSMVKWSKHDNDTLVNILGGPFSFLRVAITVPYMFEAAK